jgi:putative intracellular protease/amidase
VNIVIPSFDGMTILDAVGPYEVLSRIPLADVSFVSQTSGEVRNDLQSLALVADRTFDDVRSADALVVPGGTATRALVHDRRPSSTTRSRHSTLEVQLRPPRGSSISFRQIAAQREGAPA